MTKISCHHKFFFRTYTHKFFFFSIPIPIKFFHAHEIRLTHANKFSTLITNLFDQAYTTNFSQPQCPKIQAKVHSTTSQISNIAKIHDSQTLFKLHHAKKYNNSKKAPKPRLQHDQSCNAPNFNKSTQQHNENVSTSNSQFQISNFQSQVSNSKFQVSNF